MSTRISSSPINSDIPAERDSEFAPIATYRDCFQHRKQGNCITIDCSCPLAKDRAYHNIVCLRLLASEGFQIRLERCGSQIPFWLVSRYGNKVRVGHRFSPRFLAKPSY